MAWCKGIGTGIYPGLPNPCQPQPILTFKYSTIPKFTNDPCYTCCKPWILPRVPCTTRKPCPFAYCNPRHPYCQGLPKENLRNVVCPAETAEPLPRFFKPHSPPFPDCCCNPPWRACTHSRSTWGPNPPDAGVQIVSCSDYELPFQIQY